MKLIDLLRELISSPTKHRVVYELEGGNAYGFGLVKSKRIAIQRAFLPKGTKFPQHSHEGEEWLIIESGELDFYVRDRLRVLETGDFVHLQPGVEHSCEMSSDVWMVGVTIPGDNGYPEAPVQVNRLANIDAADLAHILNTMPQSQLIEMGAGLRRKTWEIIKETVE